MFASYALSIQCPAFDDALAYHYHGSGEYELFLFRRRTTSLTIFIPFPDLQTRLMDSVMEELPADDSDGLQLLLSACKFLDLLLILQTEDFQVHQWLFVNDTGLLAEEAMEDSILDRLATAIEEHCPGAAHKRLSAASTPSNIATTGGTRGSPDRGRSPFLVGKREIVSVADLLPFLTTMNITSFQAAVEDSHSGRADRASIERDLGADMFGDGR